MLIGSALGLLKKLPIANYLKYIEYGAILVAVLGFAWVAWTVRGAMAVRERNAAVEQAIDEVQQQLDRETKLRARYQRLADDKLDLLLQSISNIKVEHKTITNNITKEREIHREFYAQPLPPGGYEQWKRARALVMDSAASSSAP